jgi:glutathione synthase/RimK-type ligase-like ATP-grasp enzyme
MKIIFVVNHLRDWHVRIPGVEFVAARHYLTDGTYCEREDTKVFNLCNSYFYQLRGYYVSLLAEARGHQPVPDIKAIEDVQSDNVIRVLAESMDGLIQHSLLHLQQKEFEFDVYFGRTTDWHYESLSEQLFNLLRVPLLRARFQVEHGKWRLYHVETLCIDDLSAQNLAFLGQAAAECAQAHKLRSREPAAKQPSLAILHTHEGIDFPSNPAAMRKFQEAAEMLGMRTEIITKHDSDRLAQFDALFIRDTTNVNHYTYQFSRQATVAGMVVMDDPDSILKCTNKIYLTELLTRHHIPIPKTMTVYRDNIREITPTLGLPCILKVPDGAFSLGVVKAHTQEEVEQKASEMLQQSELILAQEYLPTEFDWRIGILDRKPLFACKYFMVPGHWQIMKHDGLQLPNEGMTEAVSLDQVPPQVLELSLQTAELIGDGFYGVDLKQRGQHCYIIEINDNPSIDAGNEDGVLQDMLYLEIMNVFRKRIEARKGSIAF